MKKAVVPGTFDPITSGHMDVIARAAQIFDEVVVAVSESARKSPIFTLEERTQLACQATERFENVSVLPFSNLLVDFARSIDAHVVVKGLRAVTDFEYEFQMFALNYKLDADLETFFVMSSPEYMYLSSSVVREIAGLGGDVSEMVPPCVCEALRRKF